MCLPETPPAGHRGRGIVLVTGANGFLGEACCRALSAAGYIVRALVRTPQAAGRLSDAARGGVFHCDLPHNIDERSFAGDIRALVHCAYATRATTVEETRRVNLEGAETLLRLARRSSVGRCVFISSLSAHREAASLYGRTKLQIEQMLGPGDTILKPGTIVGNGGVFARTREMLRTLPAVPLFYADRILQTIWIDDVCSAIVKAIDREIPGAFVLAHPKGVPLPHFYRKIAELDGKKPVLLPFSGDFAVFLTAAAEKLGVKLPIHSDNLLGMKHLRWFDPTDSLARLELNLLSFEESLARIG